MRFFPYDNGVLHVDDAALPEIAAEVGTPFFCYSSGALEAAYRAFAGALDGLDATVCYALKANANRADATLEDVFVELTGRYLYPGMMPASGANKKDLL